MVDINFNSTTQIYWKVTDFLSDNTVNKVGFDFSKNLDTYYELKWNPNRETMWELNHIFLLRMTDKIIKHLFE